MTKLDQDAKKSFCLLHFEINGTSAADDLENFAMFSVPRVFHTSAQWLPAANLITLEVLVAGLNNVNTFEVLEARLNNVSEKRPSIHVTEASIPCEKLL